MCKDCSHCIGEEFRPESLGLHHTNSSEFVRSQWPMDHRVYITYRLAVSIGFLAWVASDAIYETNAFFKEKPWSYLIYATNWSFLLLASTAMFMAITTLYYSVRSGECLDRQTFERTPNALKCQWLIQNLSYNSAIVVSISYWSFIVVMDHSSVLQTELSQLKHTLNTVYVLFDIFISGTPFRILHVLYTMGLGSLYSMFNAVYFLNDGTILEGRHYAYNLLNWQKPVEAMVTCALCVVLSIFSQMVLFEVYKLRTWIFTKIFFSSDSDKSVAELQSIMGDYQQRYMAVDEIDNESGDNSDEMVDEMVDIP